jgi:putative MATE family efflux protein
MRDLTTGSITRHLLGMAAFIGVGLVVQTLYFLIDLYFVARLGEHAIAGVSAAGTSWMVGMATAQMIAIGTLSLVSRAVGAKDHADASLAFNQALGLGLATGAAAAVVGYLVGPAAVRGIGADLETAAAGRAYLFAFIPAIVLMFPGAALGAGLRAVGVVGAPMIIQSLTVALNAVLAPVLIAGWGTGAPLGVAGAGLASSIAAAAGLVAMGLLFGRMQGHLRIRPEEMRPRLTVWKRLAAVGLPAGGEFFLMFVFMSVVYWVIRDFGAAAQAGFGIGARVMQSIFLPAMAVAFAAAPIAGQNYGARNGHRVRVTFTQAAAIGSGIMLALTLLCQIQPELLIRPFTTDREVAGIASEYLRIISWNFVAVGLVFACSGMFQALGDTRPAFLSSASRLLTFALPALLLSGVPGLRLEHVWYLSLASGVLQAVCSLVLLRMAFRRRLADFGGAHPLAQEPAAA